MTRRKPPALATFMLERAADCDAAIAGDLAEEYCQGRSRWWYWREAAFIVASSAYRSVRRHPVLLLRALLTMAVLNKGIVMLLMLHDFPRDLLGVVPGRIFAQFYVEPIVWNAAAFALGVVAAWLMARSHRQVRVPTVLLVSTVLFVGEITSPEFHRLIANMPESRFVPALVVNVASMLVWVAAAFIGAIVLPAERDGVSLRPAAGS
jgi:hypothetical protein